MSRVDSVMSIVVTYYPDPVQLEQTVNSLCNEVGGVALIDNSPGGMSVMAWEVVRNFREIFAGKLLVVENCDNLGIAKAQNIGVELAINNGFSYVFISDQDSVFENNTVCTLYAGHQLLISQGKRIGAMAAGYVNTVIDEKKNNKKSHPVFVQHTGYRPKRITATSGFVEATYVIASGCLIPVSVFEDVGLKDESLFIDWVDTEWCLRARSSGYEIYGSADVTVKHKLGDNHARILGRSIPLHSPVRHYYMVRNALRLALYLPTGSIKLRLWIGSRAILFVLCYPILAKPHLIHLRMVLMGLFHGVLNKKGRIDA